MRVVILDAEKKSIREMDIEPSLEKYYQLTKCRCVDMVRRKVGGLEYLLIVDDEALLKEKPIPSAVGVDGSPMIFGNIIFCNYEEEREIGLDDIEIQNLFNHLRGGRMMSTGETFIAIDGMSY